MNRTIMTILTILAIIVFAVTPATAQLNIFEPQLGIWHDGGNWSLGHFPPDPSAFPFPDAEDVLVPANKTCRVLTDVAHAKSVEVEATGFLGIENEKTLHVYPTLAALTALTVDGTLYFRGTYGADPSLDVPATLIVEITLANRSELGHVVFTGSGVITAAAADDPNYPTTKYGPGHIVDPAGVCDDPWGFEVTAGLTLKGAWNIQLSIDNNGLVLVDGPDTMDINSPVTCFEQGDPAPRWEQLIGDGVFRVSSGAGVMMIGNRDDILALYSAALEVSDGLMHFYDEATCRLDSRLDMHDGTIDVSGGELRFDDGLLSFAPGGAMINVSGGLLNALGGSGSFFNDTQVTITGGEFRTDYDVTFAEDNFPPSLSISGDGLFDIQGAVLSVTPSGGSTVQFAINGDVGAISLSCTSFNIERTNLSIQSGTFRAIGDTQLRCNTLCDSDLALSGGTLLLGGTFDGNANSSITLSAGVLDIRGDFSCTDPPENFRHQGAFTFLGGKIKVKKDKTVLID